MKRIAIIPLAITALCACSRIENTGVEEAVQLRFDPVILAATKSDIQGEYPADIPFGVQMWEYPLEKAAPDGTIFLENAQIEQQGGEWMPGDGVLWPGADRNLAVVAYSPYGKASTEITLQEGIRFDAIDTEKDQTDLLYTELRQGLHRNNDGGVVNLPFRHALCYVDFAIRTNAQASERVEIRSLSLLSVATKGDFRSLPQPEWDLTEAPHKVTFFNGLKLIGSTNTLLPGSGAWVLPQLVKSIVHADLDYTAPNGDIIPYSLESDPLVKILEPGRHYTIILSYKSGEEILEVDETSRQSL